MKDRLLVAAVGIPFLLVILLACPAFVTAICIAILMAIASYELLRSTGLVQDNVLLVSSAIMAIVICGLRYFISDVRFSSMWSHTPGFWYISAAIVFLYTFVLVLESLRKYPTISFSSITISFFAGVIIPLSMSALIRLRAMELGKLLVFIPIIIPFISDAGAYFAGRFFGKRKLAPVLSPKKTIEGAIGGIVTGVLSMIILCIIAQFGFKLHVNYLFATIYGIIGSIISILGDLTFSMIKRECGIKDYGKLFRSHGGVLDRFDSMVLSAPVIELFLIFIPVIWK